MPKGCVLLDTSFFIRLLKEDDRLHQNAVITPRTVVPNDTKMFAQADLEDEITHYVSADSEATKVFSLINEEYKMKFAYVDISVPHRQVFGELF